MRWWLSDRGDLKSYYLTFKNIDYEVEVGGELLDQVEVGDDMYVDILVAIHLRVEIRVVV